MKLKIVEVNALLTAIRECQAFFSTSAAPVRFSFTLAKNAAVLLKEVTLAQETIIAGVDLDALRARDARRRELAKERAVLDERGAPVVINGEYRLASAEVVRSINLALDEEFPGSDTVVALVTSREAEAEKIEVDLELTKLPLADWPNLPAPLVERLMPLITE